MAFDDFGCYPFKPLDFLQQLQTGPFETFGDNRFVQIGADRSLRHLIDMQRNYFCALS